MPAYLKKTKTTAESPLPPKTLRAGAAVPPEILFEIIQEVARPSCDDKGKVNHRTRALGAMCRVNKYWQSIAHNSLYQCISFVEKPEQMSKLRRTVVSSPAIAGHITELDIQVVGERRDLPNAPAALRKAVAKRQRAGKDLWDILEVLTGLKKLKIRRLLKLPKAYYQECLQSTKRFPNLSTVRSFDIIKSDTAIATVLIQSMTSLEELCASGMPSPQGDLLNLLFEGMSVHLTQLSVTGIWCSEETNNWNDWYNVVKCSKDTLHTLVLEQTDGMPSFILERALELVSSSLLRLFYSTRLHSLQAVLLAALPKFKKLISLRTSLPTITVLELIPPTIMELGMAHQSRYYEEIDLQIDRVQVVRRGTLNRAKDLPNLKILWLAGAWGHREEEDRQLEEWKETAVAEGMACKLLTPSLNRLCMLPVYGNEDELLYLPELRLIPGVYVAGMKSGTTKVFDPAVFSRLTQI